MLSPAVDPRCQRGPRLSSLSQESSPNLPFLSLCVYRPAVTDPTSQCNPTTAQSPYYRFRCRHKEELDSLVFLTFNTVDRCSAVFVRLNEQGLELGVTV